MTGAKARGYISTIASYVGGRQLKVTCLGSGSSGNCILVQARGHALLVDVGLSARKISTALQERGVILSDLEAILLTHEHSDHVAGLPVLMRSCPAPVLANADTLAEVQRRTRRPDYCALPTGAARTIGPFEVISFPVSHDAVAPVGYVIEAEGARITVATDLGCASSVAIEAMSQSDLIVLEANHDVHRLVTGPYPHHLKRRILGENGHLSNAQAADMICEALNTREQTYWLAHLSRTNNTRQVALEGVSDCLAAEGLRTSIFVAERDRPSLVWEGGQAL